MLKSFVTGLFALCVTLAMFAAGAGTASAATAHYRAEPATAAAKATLIVKDLVWKCGEAGCVAGKSNSRPPIDCSALVRELGALRSFAVEGRPLSAPELEKCNARVR